MDVPVTSMIRKQQLMKTEKLGNLALALLARFEELQEMKDLEVAINCLEQALALCPPGHHIRFPFLNNLANALSTRHEQLGEIKDLEQAITYNKQALDLLPPDHPLRSSSLNNLAMALTSRYEQLGDIKYLEEAIHFNQQALELCPPSHPFRPKFLSDFAQTLSIRYEQLGGMKDLEDAITCYEQALKLWLPRYPLKPSFLNNISHVLFIRYEQLGKIKDLEEAISWVQLALKLCTPGHSQRSSLNNLACAMLARYKQFGDLKDLEEAITCYEQALELSPPGNVLRPTPLHNVASALLTRYEQMGEIKDLQKAIVYHEQALELPLLPSYFDRSLWLSSLANALSARHERYGGIEDLERAITCYKQALELNPPGHPDRPESLNNLASALSTRYKQLGEMDDLEGAISWNKQALELSPPGHPARSSFLNTFANSLVTRYNQLENTKDLKEAITYYEQALKLCPPGNLIIPTLLNNFANALSIRCQQPQNINDLEEAIVFYKKALELCPPGHSDRCMSLTNLGGAFSTKYDQVREVKDLWRAIAYHKQALKLCPSGHPDRPVALHNIAHSLSTRYQQFGKTKDLEKAVAGFKAALSCLPLHHPLYSSVLFAQALLTVTAHEFSWVLCDGCSHIDEACVFFELAACHVTSSLQDRFRAAKKWASTAHTHQHKSAISAYSVALDLWQQHLSLSPSMISQQKLMENSAQLSMNAASCAISADKLDLAVQFLEQGRSIIWSKIQGYRQSFAAISERDPQLANEFQATSNQLEHNAVSSGVDVALQRKLSDKWRALLEKIREIDGLSDYLRPVPFITLQSAAKEGPVIMVNISIFQSDAVILVSHAPPVIVALHDTSPGKLKKLAHQLSEATNGIGPFKGVVGVLQQLWYTIVQPVVKQLVHMKIPDKLRIWWCPTSYLCALPLHAAGPYKRGLKNLPDLYISSYIPTLASLIRARSEITKLQPTLNFLLVSQTDSTIPHVIEEVQVIKGFGKPIDLCSGGDADKQGVLDGLKSHSWVHFACHGHLEDQPFDSWFQLHNREHLTILDIAKAKLPNAEFAFLSACHSAAGNIYGTPDEYIHLAAALQFCGFRSVVGTLWAMVDAYGPTVAGAFYKHMFHKADTVDLRDAAEALNIATKELRRQHVPLVQWINFIHIGA